MITIAIAFTCTLLVNIIILRYKRLHEHFSSDTDLNGVQKFHQKAVPRIGGLGIMMGLSIGFLLRYLSNHKVGEFGLLLVCSALPAFLLGFLEDITKRVSANVRFMGGVISASLAGYLLEAWLSSLQVFGLDNLMVAFPSVAVVMTCFAVTGLANAFNIIDGYNGLSSMVGVIILSAVAYVAFQLHDIEVMVAAIAMVGAVSAFFFFNYPRGLIFLGDGGAYLIGFWIAELSVLLTARHPEVSKWFPLLLCCYPVLETLFTIYRRIWIRGTSPGLPDATHMHQIIYRRVVKWSVGSTDPLHLLIRNSLTAPYLWGLTLLSVIPAVLFWNNVWILRLFTLIFVITYVYLYRSIVKFKTPKFLIIQNNQLN
jgi:UDP-N-acetylmuramyl pentapeptide phosphotransferase/UDP-N-acetylglucosamine-1-phosphate transferase